MDKESDAMKSLIPLHRFKKKGYWLAVVAKGRSMYVAASAKEPKRALEAARTKGYRDAALMQSAPTYAAFTA